MMTRACLTRSWFGRLRGDSVASSPAWRGGPRWARSPWGICQHHALPGVVFALVTLSTVGTVGWTAQPPTTRLTQPPAGESSSDEAGNRRGRASLGIEIRDALPRRGVTVLAVSPGSAGAAAGLKPGDRIVAFAGRLIRNADDLIREVSLRRVGDEVTLGVIRDNAILEFETDLTPRGVAGRNNRDAGTSGAMPSEATRPSESEGQDRTTRPANRQGGGLGNFGSLLGDFFKPPVVAQPNESNGQPTEADTEVPRSNDEEDTRRIGGIDLPAARSESVGNDQNDLQQPSLQSEVTSRPSRMETGVSDDDAASMERVLRRLAALEAEIRQLRRQVESMQQ